MGNVKRHLWIPFLVVALVVTVTLAGTALLFAGRQDELWAWLRPQAAFVVFILWSATLAAFAIPRRGEGRPILLLTLTGLTSLAVVGGLATFTPCSGDGDPILTPIWSTLLLFTGDPSERFSEAASCRGAVPLSLQVARTAAIGAAFATVVAASLALWRRPFARLRIRFMKFSAVVLGMDESMLPVVERLVAERRKGDSAVAVIVPAGFSPDLLARLDSLAAVVVVSDPAGQSILRSLLTRAGRVAVQSVYVLDPDRHAATAAVDAVTEVVKAVPGVVETPVYVVVRIDDVHHAGRVRLKYVDPGSRLVVDAISPIEITAAELLGRVMRLGIEMDSRPTTLVLLGDTPLTTAVLAEVGRRFKEQERLAEAERGSQNWGRASIAQRGQDSQDLIIIPFAIDKVVVFDPAADDIVEYCMLGDDWSWLKLDAQRRDPSEVRAWLKPQDDTKDFAVVFASSSPQSWHQAARLAALTDSQVWVNSGKEGTDEQVGNLSEFSESLLFAGALPESIWSRMARLSHEVYRRAKFPVPSETFPEGLPAKRLPWWYRDDDRRVPLRTREDNIAQIRGVMVAIQDQQYEWVTAESADGNPPAGLNGCWYEIARAEHRRWVAARQSQGWRYGAVENEADKEHPDLVPFAELPSGSQAWLVGYLPKLIAGVGDYGYVYRPTPDNRNPICAPVEAETPCLTCPYRKRADDYASE
jgi:hypothetical protein